MFVSIPPEARIDRKRIKESEPIFKADNLVRAWETFGMVSGLGRLFSIGVSTAQMTAIADQMIADHVEEDDIYVRLGIHSKPDGSSAEKDISQADNTGPQLIIDAPEEPAQEPLTATSPNAAALSEAPTAAPETPSPSSRKASAPIEVCAGIMERALPDGRIAFRAAADDAIGREALTALCKGKAAWNPMFANWVCPPEIASEIRANLPHAVQMAQLP